MDTADVSDNGPNGAATTTRYRILATAEERRNRWVRIRFDEADDTAANAASLAPKPKSDKRAKAPPGKRATEDDAGGAAPLEGAAPPDVPDSVLRWERQLRKLRAADRAGKTAVNIEEHLRTVYADEHIVVADKPSGILCVPGVNKHLSLLDLVYEVYGSKAESNGESPSDGSSPSSETALPRDSMIVHRLDMDTSGLVVFARTRSAMSKLHAGFRERTGTTKVYEALLLGRLEVDQWLAAAEGSSGVGADAQELNDTEERSAADLGGGEIHLPLQRDHRHPPFMRVSTPESEAAARLAVRDLNHAGYRKLVAKKPKASTTHFRILGYETWEGHAVTRVELVPITGRTHQLRVHCAALGHPILGDSAYGFCGEAHAHGGFGDAAARAMAPTCATFALRQAAEADVQEGGRTMCLHARRLTVAHPATGDPISFEALPSF